MDNSELVSVPNNSVQTLVRQNEFVVHTFGCKVNTYDTGLIQKNLTQNGFNTSLKFNQKNAIHVLNTCAVTSEATQQAVRLIRKIKSQDPLATVVVTGCAAQVDTGAFEKLTAADLIVANSHKGLLPQIIDQYFKRELKERVFKSNIFKKDDLEAGGGIELSHTRSFLKIQDGCNSFCSFCIIPYARGKSRSIPISQIITQINQEVISGVQEIVLTGVHIGDYEDIVGLQSKNLTNLVSLILEKTNIKRIRLSSLEPVEVTEDLLALYKNERLCPHFHMSIQSATTDVLRQMKRQYTEVEVSHSLKRIKELMPEAYIGMDVIAGFPTETDEQFENTYRLLSEAPWTRLHVFPYSERPGTRAATFEQLHMSKRKERATRLRSLSLHRLQAEALKQVGLIKNVLVLKNNKKTPTGLSRDYWNVELDLDTDEQNQFVNTEIQFKIESVRSDLNDVKLIGKRV